MPSRRNGKLPTAITVALIAAGGGVLVALIALIGNLVDRSSTPVVVNVNMPTGMTPVSTSSSSPFPSPPTANKTSHAPVILNIQSQPVESGGWDSGNMVEYYLYFSDVDGDAYSVRYSVTDSSTPGIVLPDSRITSTPKMQIAGTIEALSGLKCEGHWRTFWTGYAVMVSVAIVDKAGNVSNSFPLQYSCIGW